MWLELTFTYGRSWQGVTLEKFMQHIDSYMVWYRDMRIKLSLGGLSPAEYRTKMWGPFSPIKCPQALTDYDSGWPPIMARSGPGL